jgi:hypothetical protein
MSMHGQGNTPHRGSENVFEEVGFEAEEAANLKIRADLLLDLRQ